MGRTLPKDARLIPPTAKSVFKGNIFEVFQWPQKLYDGSEEIFEMLRRCDTVTVLAIKDNELIYAEDQQPPNRFRVGLPGGRVDEGEDWLDAAKREMKEETGMSFKNWRLINVSQPVDKMEWFIALYLAWDYDESAYVTPNPGPGEKITIKTNTINEVVAASDNGGLKHLPNIIKNVKTIDDILNIEEYHGAST